ncbi:type II secretion system protein [Shewanella sp.]|uniref:type II secretion system protein n=1 Tax=Shewanella sp. TaxID=50422 RepID=UPI003D0BAA40
MRKQQGFTLIELVVVIIILGILAVVAAPKFMNLQGDAKASTLKGMEAALKGANSIVYSKAVIKGIEKADGSHADNDYVTIDSAATPTTIKTVYGYIAGDKDEVAKALEASSSDWTIEKPADDTVSSANVIIHLKDNSPSATNKCFLEYTQASASGSLPTYSVVNTNC